MDSKERKLYKFIFYFYIFLFLGGYKVNFIFAKSIKIQKIKLSFIASNAGRFSSVRSKIKLYYASKKRKFALLYSDDKVFKVVRYIQFPQSISAYDIGDINADKKNDIILISTVAVYVMLQKPNYTFTKPIQIIEGNFKVPYYSKNIERITLGKDLDKDGFFDFILPSEGKFLFYAHQNNNNNNNNKKQEIDKEGIKRNSFFNNQNLGKKNKIDNKHFLFSLQREIPFKIENSVSTFYQLKSNTQSDMYKIISKVPKIYFYDFNLDNIDDIYFRVKKIVYYGISSQKPLKKIFLKYYNVPFKKKIHSKIQMIDLNNDHRADLIFSYLSGSGIDINTVIHVFWGTKQHKIPVSDNSSYYKVKGGIYTPFVIQHPKRKILMVPSVNIGTSTVIKYLLSKSISLHFNFLEIKNKIIKEFDDFSHTTDVEKNMFPAFCITDINNDKISDIIIAEDNNSVYVYYGNDDMEEDKVEKMVIPDRGRYISISSKSNNKEMLIIFPYSIKNMNRRYIYKIKFVNHK